MKTFKQFLKESKQINEEIDDRVFDTLDDASELLQWAASTCSEGDYKQAVKHIEKSIKLSQKAISYIKKA